MNSIRSKLVQDWHYNRSDPTLNLIWNLVYSKTNKKVYKVLINKVFNPVRDNVQYDVWNMIRSQF